MRQESGGFVLDTGNEIDASLPVTALVDQFYKEVSRKKWVADVGIRALFKRLNAFGEGKKLPDRTDAGRA